MKHWRESGWKTIFILTVIKKIFHVFNELFIFRVKLFTFASLVHKTIVCIFSLRK